MQHSKARESNQRILYSTLDTDNMYKKSNLKVIPQQPNNITTIVTKGYEQYKMLESHQFVIRMEVMHLTYFRRIDSSMADNGASQIVHI